MNNVKAFWCEHLGLTQEAFARFHGCTRDAVTKWQNGTHDVKYEFARRYGLNYGWLVGDDTQMWSERVITLRQSLRSYLSTATIQARTASDRFRCVLSYLREQAPDLVFDEYIAQLLRMDVETYREALSGNVTVSTEAIQRLAAFSNVPVDWFATGEQRYVADEESLNDLARDYGLSIEDAKEAIVREANRRFHTA